MELDNFGFEIERAPQNNETWEDIGFVEGAGNSYKTQWYAFIDNSVNPLYKSYRYRLKQLNYNGDISYLGELNVGVNFTDVIDSRKSQLILH